MDKTDSLPSGARRGAAVRGAHSTGRLSDQSGPRGYIMLDVGGTQIKAGLIGGKGELLGEISHYPSHAREGKEEILCHLSFILAELMERAKNMDIGGIGMAFPGPFDYERGISLMKGLDKYDQIYGLSIEDEIKARAGGLQGVPFHFLHDVEAFALGESRFGEAKDAHRLLCLCIGTGAGSAFIEDQRALRDEKDGVPADGWLYSIPYQDSIIDDYLSVRGLKKISREVLGEEAEGKELYERCLEKEEKALTVFQIFGRDVKACLVPFLDSFRPDCLVFGGQISKSFSYFGGDLWNACEERGIQVYLEQETSVRAMQGLYVTMNRGGTRC